VNVPVLDLKAQYAALKDEIDAALQRVCENSWFKLGPEVEQFERDWAEFCGAEHCVAVNSGTSALHLALEALGIGEGDEVITTALSFFATAEAILYTGARPVFVDVRPENYCLDPALIDDVLTERTRAVMPVHLFGHPAEMDPIMELAREHDLAVIEDAAQAHGAEYRGRRVGAIGDVGCFSFYVTKNLGAFGEAGACTTDDAALAERMRLLRNHGQAGGYFHECVGYNYRMSGFQGAVLNVKLKRLKQWTARRRQIAGAYSEGLAVTPLILPAEAEGCRSAWHLYVVRCPERDALKEHLAEAGVSAVIHYPSPMTELHALEDHDLAQTPVPESKKISGEVLSLPIFPEMTDAQVEHVIEQVMGFYSA
jgi:dTDP-4-amino-4,6-dideoxygalactose transaminase